MSRIKTKAEYLLEELRLIPKMIKQLKLDVEATRSSLLTSPQWSDMKVSGGVRRTQTDKNVSIIDASDYGLAEIDRLVKRREEIIGVIMQIPDSAQRHVLLTTYLNCQTFDEAIDKLELNRNKYYTIKAKAVRSLNVILNQY
ncbi:hypothetical protein Si116_00871 [Streptococcus infantarius subsp. infantarius]|nr:hypothetical protein [Streptococcus infantarius subsp. infantarius]MCO4492146.1 hypothetical protein [Streptococcus infantarius subsp. infantarius]MCO4510103.1 hypothetical protein [Streptococcus infantarius subsp. infantarius]